jgi:hypothetical protein
MSRDFVIYAKRETTIPLDHILTHMRSRGVPVEWTYTISTESTRFPDWTMGYFYLEGEADAQSRVSASTERLADDLRQEAISIATTEAHRAILRDAQTMYNLSASSSARGEHERMLVNLVDLLLKLGDGLVLDAESGILLDRAEFRRENLALLGNTPSDGS